MNLEHRRLPSLIRRDLDLPKDLEAYYTRWSSLTHKARESLFPSWSVFNLRAVRLDPEERMPLSQVALPLKSDRYYDPSRKLSAMAAPSDFRVVEVSHERTGLRYEAEVHGFDLRTGTSPMLHSDSWVWRFDPKGNMRLLNITITGNGDNGLVMGDGIMVDDYVGESMVEIPINTNGFEDGLINTYPITEGGVVMNPDHWSPVRLRNLSQDDKAIYREACGAAFIGLAANLATSSDNMVPLEGSLAAITEVFDRI